MNTLHKIIMLVTATIFCSALVAQGYYVPEGYVGYYDYDHRVIERQWVLCEDDYQDLWNGCTVRIYGDIFHIYQDGKEILWANQAYLLPNGNYCICYSDENVWYVCDPSGKQMFWGNEIETLWNGFYNVRFGNAWHLYNPEGKDTDFWSYEPFRLYSNGYFQYISGNKMRVLTPELKDLNIWGDEITLRNDNSFRARIGSNYYFYSLKGKQLPNP